MTGPAVKLSVPFLFGMGQSPILPDTDKVLAPLLSKFALLGVGKSFFVGIEPALFLPLLVLGLGVEVIFIVGSLGFSELLEFSPYCIGFINIMFNSTIS